MKKSQVFWRIEIEYHLKFHHTMVIPGGQITDSKIEKLLEILIAKYMLTDDEIVTSLCKKRTRRYHNYLDYQKDSQLLATGQPRITYRALISSMSVVIISVNYEELTESEKEVMKTKSSFQF